MMFARLSALLRPPAGSPFTNAKLFSLFLPVLLEQLITALMGIADTLLASSFSDCATAGVSHAFIIYNVASTFVLGLTLGGGIVTLQYYGSKNHQRASDSARCSLVLSVLVAAAFCAILMLFPSQIISILMGDVGREVLGYARIYLLISSLVLPFTAIFCVCAATYRAQGNTRVPMLASVMILLISFVCKYLFSTVLPLGVEGTALANLIANVVVAAGLMLAMRKKKLAVSFRRADHPFLEKDLFRKVVHYSFPTALENASVQIGLMLVQRIIVGYGVVESAAHAIASRLQPFAYLPAYCWGIVSTIVSGQCCGAGNTALARKSIRHIMRLSFVWMIAVDLFWILVSDPLIHLFGGSEQALTLAKKLFIFYCVCTVLMYYCAYGLPQALRGGGDVQYTMIVSLATMFLVRIGLAYVLGTSFGLGSFGVWIAMAIDWAIRCLLYLLRFRSEKWAMHSAV